MRQHCSSYLLKNYEADDYVICAQTKKRDLSQSAVSLQVENKKEMGRTISSSTLLYLAIPLLLTFLIQVQGDRCIIVAEINVNDKLDSTKSECSGNKLTIALSNEYRGYCSEGSSHCRSRHRAYQHPDSELAVVSCIPIPLNNVYNVVRHQNYNASCGSSYGQWEVVNFEYVNATRCSCRKLFDDAII